MSQSKRILVTGATGKVGQHFIEQFLNDPTFDSFIVRALCHHRTLDSHDRLEDLIQEAHLPGGHGTDELEGQWHHALIHHDSG